jgi:hypothetical protein
VEFSKTYRHRFTKPYFQPYFLNETTLVATIPTQQQTLLPYFDIVGFHLFVFLYYYFLRTWNKVIR